MKERERREEATIDEKKIEKSFSEILRCHQFRDECKKDKRSKEKERMRDDFIRMIDCFNDE
jgi:hypothetical protein